MPCRCGLRIAHPAILPEESTATSQDQLLAWRIAEAESDARRRRSTCLRQVGLSPVTVQRIWHEHRIYPRLLPDPTEETALFHSRRAVAT